MAPLLPRLRVDLDIMPSPLKEQPGLLIRDPFRFSDATLIVPPVLARCLGCFDGEQTEQDLRTALARVSGQSAVARVAQRFVAALRDAGFLDDDVFAEMRAARRQAFAGAAVRDPAHAGSGYPAEPAALTDTLAGYLAHADGAPRARSERTRPARGAPVARKPGAARDGRAGELAGVAAPHVSPEGGIACYAAAYKALPPDLG